MQEFFKGLSEQVKVLLWPERYYAWQTLLLLSIFSLVVGLTIDALDGPTVSTFSVEVLSTLSWVFFTAAIWWALTENPIKVGNFSIGPWITGAVLCLFLFRPWNDPRFRLSLSVWPMLSTAVMALPYFLDWKLEFKLPKKPEARQLLVMTALINLLLTCWILFYFRVQDWVSNYPTLLVSDLRNSAFVSDLGVDRSRPAQGAQLLQNATDAIGDELSAQPWYQTERWLYSRENRLQTILERATQSMESPDERIFWRLRVASPRRLEEGYLLTLQANWVGPVSQDQGFFLEKTCKILPIDQVRPIPTRENQPPPLTKLTSVSCEEGLPALQWIKEPSSAG